MFSDLSPFDCPSHIYAEFIVFSRKGIQLVSPLPLLILISFEAPSLMLIYNGTSMLCDCVTFLADLWPKTRPN